MSGHIVSKTIKTGIRYIKDKNFRFVENDRYGIHKLSDEEYIRRLFEMKMGYPLDLDNPRTINEKLQWLKLYDRRPEYTVMVDKVAAKDYVAGVIGKEYIIPTLGVWDDPDDINFDSLPNQFVLKCNHNSGLGMCICKDKSKLMLDIKKIKADLRKGLKQDYYMSCREWPYRDVPRKIIAEQLLMDSQHPTSSINDYKVYTFNGKAKILGVYIDRFVDTKANYYSSDFAYLDFTWGYPHFDRGRGMCTSNFNLMLQLAEKLSKDIPQLRCDFYDVDGQVYFGELTFFDGGGFDIISPVEWDIRMGDWIELPR